MAIKHDPKNPRCACPICQPPKDGDRPVDFDDDDRR